MCFGCSVGSQKLEHDKQAASEMKKKSWNLSTLYKNTILIKKKKINSHISITELAHTDIDPNTLMIISLQTISWCKPVTMDI